MLLRHLTGDHGPRAASLHARLGPSRHSPARHRCDLCRRGRERARPDGDHGIQWHAIRRSSLRHPGAAGATHAGPSGRAGAGRADPSPPPALVARAASGCRGHDRGARARRAPACRRRAHRLVDRQAAQRPDRRPHRLRLRHRARVLPRERRPRPGHHRAVVQRDQLPADLSDERHLQAAQPPGLGAQDLPGLRRRDRQQHGVERQRLGEGPQRHPHRLRPRRPSGHVLHRRARLHPGGLAAGLRRLLALRRRRHHAGPRPRRA